MTDEQYDRECERKALEQCSADETSDEEEYAAAHECRRVRETEGLNRESRQWKR
jgi:hypothetical protein